MANKEFEIQMESKFDDCYANIDANKDKIEDLKKDLTGLKNEMIAKLAGAAMSSPSGPSTSKADKAATSVNTEVFSKRIKDVEQSVINLNNKFQEEIDRLQLMQPVGDGTSGEGAAASAKLMDMTVKKIEARHDAFSKRMSQIDVKVQNALTDT